MAERALHGNLTRAQLLELGLNSQQIAYRVRIGRLYRVHPRVYAVGRRPTLALERAAAAVLACGTAAWLSHRAALALWDLADWPSVLDVTVAADRRPAGIRVHRCTTLSSRDVRKRHGIPVTSPARAMLDCAPEMSDRALTRLVNQALRAPHLTLTREQLAELLRRCPKHPGAARLKPHATSTEAPTRSQFEDDFRDFCRHYGIPEPRVNTQVCGREVDAYFEAHRLIVELDGWSYHNDRDSFKRDRDRDADAYAQGIGTVRITWEGLHDDPDREADRLNRILSL